MATTADERRNTVEIIEPPTLSSELHIPLATLAQWRYRKVGPPWIRVGRHIRYRRSDVEAWLTAQTEMVTR